MVVDLPAEKTIGHAWYGRFYKPVTTAKPEVLSQPHEVDENGDRKPLSVDTGADIKKDEKK